MLNKMGIWIRSQDRKTLVKPKKAIKLKEKECIYTHECPVCHQYVGTVFDDGVEHDDYCCSCGQRLDWSEDDGE